MVTIMVTIMALHGLRVPQHDSTQKLLNPPRWRASKSGARYRGPMEAEKNIRKPAGTCWAQPKKSWHHRTIAEISGNSKVAFCIRRFQLSGVSEITAAQLEKRPCCGRASKVQGGSHIRS